MSERDSPRGRFLAIICTRHAGESERVAEVLLQELNATFLWHETLKGKDAETFTSLGRDAVQNIFTQASRSNVLITKTDKGWIWIAFITMTPNIYNQITS
jgi:hypothetical protein